MFVLLSMWSLTKCIMKGIQPIAAIRSSLLICFIDKCLESQRIDSTLQLMYALKPTQTPLK